MSKPDTDQPKLKCAVCGETVKANEFIADCDLCANLVDACASCFQNHVTEQHEDTAYD